MERREFLLSSAITLLLAACNRDKPTASEASAQAVMNVVELRTLDDLRKELERIPENLRRSSFYLKTIYDHRKLYGGTGTVIEANNDYMSILTARHVVDHYAPNFVTGFNLERKFDNPYKIVVNDRNEVKAAKSEEKDVAVIAMRRPPLELQNYCFGKENFASSIDTSEMYCALTFPKIEEGVHIFPKFFKLITYYGQVLVDEEERFVVYGYHGADSSSGGVVTGTDGNAVAILNYAERVPNDQTLLSRVTQSDYKSLRDEALAQF